MFFRIYKATERRKSERRFFNELKLKLALVKIIQPSTEISSPKVESRSLVNIPNELEKFQHFRINTPNLT